MNTAQLNKLLGKFGKSVSDLEHHPDDYKSFGTAEYEPECCPDCACEVEVKQNGKSTCDKCGHKNILPCARCPLNDMSLCDWDEKTKCSAFPTK